MRQPGTRGASERNDRERALLTTLPRTAPAGLEAQFFPSEYPRGYLGVFGGRS